MNWFLQFGAGGGAFCAKSLYIFIQQIFIEHLSYVSFYMMLGKHQLK